MITLIFSLEALVIGVGVAGGLVVLALSAGIIYYIAKKRSQAASVSLNHQTDLYATFSNESSSTDDPKQPKKVLKIKQR